MTDAVKPFWDSFLRETGRQKDLLPYDCFRFDLNEKNAEYLLELVLAGQKRATASSEASFVAQGLQLPCPGFLSVVTHFDGTPACVIETTTVTVLPFREITWDICRREGEDENLASWQRGHARFFTEEGKLLNYSFSEDMPVVFEDFKVVYPAQTR